MENLDPQDSTTDLGFQPADETFDPALDVPTSERCEVDASRAAEPQTSASDGFDLTSEMLAGAEERLVLTQPGEHEEHILIKVLGEIENLRQRRSRRHKVRHDLVTMSIRLPRHEMLFIRAYCRQWAYNYTDLARFLMMAHIPLLKNPPAEILKMLEANRVAEADRKVQRELKRNKQFFEMAS